MKLSADLQVTRRRAEIRRHNRTRAEQSDYQREKNADTGSPMPALRILAAVLAVALVGWLLK